MSMGDFRASFAIGHGTTSTQLIDDGDGTYTFILGATFDTTYTVIPPPDVLPSGPTGGPTGMNKYYEWLKTAEATTASDSVHVQIWPRDHLLNSSLSAKGCFYYPFIGSWAEANAQGFSWSYSGGATQPSSSTDSTKLASSPNVLKFQANGPHYKKRTGSEPLELNPARVQVFLPTSYFTGLGYESLETFDATSYSVTAEDGQTTAPSLSKRSDGILINLGIKHYSAPNPTITFKNAGSTSTAQTSTTLPALSASTSTSTTIPSPLKMLKAGSRNLSSLISYSGTGTRKWTTSGGCTVLGSKLRAPSRKTTCTVTLTVRSKSNKVTYRKTVKVAVA
jgi:hypothetical protein